MSFKLLSISIFIFSCSILRADQHITITSDNPNMVAIYSRSLHSDGFQITVLGFSDETVWEQIYSPLSQDLTRHILSMILHPSSYLMTRLNLGILPHQDNVGILPTRYRYFIVATTMSIATEQTSSAAIGTWAAFQVEDDREHVVFDITYRNENIIITSPNANQSQTVPPLGAPANSTQPLASPASELPHLLSFGSDSQSPY